MNISRLIIAAILFAFVSSPVFADGKKVKMCHKGKDIRVNEHAVNAHIDHGDTKGKCRRIKAVVMIRCINNKGMIQVSGLSSSYNEAYIQPTLGTEEEGTRLSCAEVVARTMNKWYTLKEVSTGFNNDETEYLFVRKILRPEDY